MAWFGKKAEAEKKQSATVALEGLSVDMLSSQLKGLEEELYGAGFSVRRLEFPSSSSSENIPGLTQNPKLLKSAQSLGIIAALDRARTFLDATSNATPGEITLLTGSVLTTAAWLATLPLEYGERVALYRWLDELEFTVFGQHRLNLVILLDCLPDHIDLQETVIAPVGWADRSVPDVAKLRERYIEAAKLFPGTKIIPCYKEELLKPDSEVRNELWNLVRRIVLKTNIPPKRTT